TLWFLLGVVVWRGGVLAPGIVHAAPVRDAWMTAVNQAIPDDLVGQPIADIRFEGNRRVESEAMMLELDSHLGELVSRRTLANDLRRLWGLGFFEDVSVAGELTTRGVVLVYTVKERPSIR